MFCCKPSFRITMKVNPVFLYSYNYSLSPLHLITVSEVEQEATTSAATSFVSAEASDSILTEQKEYGLDAQTEEMLKDSDNILEGSSVEERGSLVTNEEDGVQTLSILQGNVVDQLQQDDVVSFISPEGSLLPVFVSNCAVHWLKCAYMG